MNNALIEYSWQKSYLAPIERRSLTKEEFYGQFDDLVADEYPNKHAAPLFLTTTFSGKQRQQSFVTGVTGIEIDYDFAKSSKDKAVPFVSFATMCANLAHLEGVLYTTASHSENAPRIRGVFLLDHPVLLAQRGHFVDYLNDLLGNCLAKESWVPTQPYYFSNITEVPYFTKRLTGAPIDSFTTAPLVALPRQAIASKDNGKYDPLMSKGASGVPFDVIAQELQHLDTQLTYPDWSRIVWAGKLETYNSAAGYDLFKEWSSRGVKFEEAEFNRVWNQGDNDHPNALTWNGVRKQYPEIVISVKRIPNPERQLEPMFGWAKNQPEIDWLVQDLIPERSVGFIYGAPAKGKTFWALDLAAKMANGEQWNGLYTSAKGVLYIPAEDQLGVGLRTRAYAKTFATSKNLIVFPHRLNLLDLGDVTEITDLVKAHGGISLIIWDTFAKSHTGSENDQEEMERLLAVMQSISCDTGVANACIHHTGKDEERGMRGSSGLVGGADFIVRVHGEPDARLATVEKSKNGSVAHVWGFELEKVDLGVLDQYGAHITSCVVRPCDAVLFNQAKPLTKQELALVLLIENRIAGKLTKNKQAEDSMDLDVLAELTAIEFNERAIKKCKGKPRTNEAKDAIIKATGVFRVEGNNVFLAIKK